MDMDLAAVDPRIAEHRTRVAFADRFGALRSTGSTTAPSRRVSPAAVTAVGNLIRVVGTAWRSLGDLAHDSRVGLRSKEQELAALGMRWPTDAAHDHKLAEEVRAARQRRPAAATIPPLAPGPLVRGNGTATGTPRASSGGVLARVGERLRAPLNAAAAGRSGPSGDEVGRHWKPGSVVRRARLVGSASSLDRGQPAPRDADAAVRCRERPATSRGRRRPGRTSARDLAA